MQTDQDEAQGQGESQKEPEEKAQRENEEMEVRCSVLVSNTETLPVFDLINTKYECNLYF